MSETSVESSRSSGGGSGNFFTRKMGILPVWAWAAIVLGLVFAYSEYKKNKAGATTSTTTQSAATNNTPGGVDSSLVPQFINQTYENVTPPAAPNVTVNNTLPPDNDTPPPATTTPPPPTTTPTTPKSPTPRPTTPFEPIFNGTYIVKKGQTLLQVATQFHISREQLAHANGLGTGAGLRTGQSLKVPVPAPAGAPNKAQLWRLRLAVIRGLLPLW